MRQYKFRAWDGGEMVFSQHPKPTKSVRIKFGEVSLVEKYFNEASGQDAEMRINAEIMQYTGLKDKNGTEIYEGDVVNAGYTKNAVIRFNEGAFMVESHLGWMLISDCVEAMYEVIGNIYETPELLEVENERD